MKQVLLFLALVAPCVGWGQIIVNGINLNEQKDVGYIELYMPDPAGTMMREVRVFYSEDKTANQNCTLKNEKGEKLTFFSTVSALNYFYKNGWEMAWHYPGAVENSTPYRFLLKKRLTSQ